MTASPLSPPAAARPLIELEDVDVAIAGNVVLHRISWRLGAAERWGVIGGNGSGKTTLLRLLAGSAWPVPGRGSRRYDFGAGPEHDAVHARQRITLAGHELQDRYARWGFRFSALDVVLSGVYRTDVPRRRPSSPERLQALAVLRHLSLAELAERSFLTLSRGEQRRVLIARALAFRPAVLLLDEPASGLDAAARARLEAMLELLAAATPAGGAPTPAIVCTAHAAEDLPGIVTRCVELAGGRIVATPPAFLCKSGLRAATAARLGVRGSRGPEAAPTVESPGARTVSSPAQTERSPLIEVRNADVWLGSRRVLHRIDWRLARGEQWVVTGRNGAGKSTFLRLLHGQVRPARGGRVSWPGLGDPRDVWQLRRQVAWLSPELQAGYRFPSTVRSCIGSGFESSIGLTRPLTRVEAARVDELLEMFELGELAERPTDALSYGQFRRALIARALVNRPRVLLLDEPWEGLDAGNAALLDAELARVAAAGTQLVCASHLTRHRQHFTHELTLAAGEIIP